jgi:hypothetical protein
MSSWNGQEQVYLSYIFKLDVHLQDNVSFCRHCTHFVSLEITLQISSEHGDDDDDDDEHNDGQQEEERISENS